jgi:glycosyltransferase involved in cell wall biosynthesis
MQSLSVVIVCRNEADIIGTSIKSLAGLTDDIIVYDNGSTDDTLKHAASFGVQLHRGEWKGFGPTKRVANALAKYDWILSLDADEAIDEELKSSLLQLSLTDVNTVYDIQFKNFLGNKHLKYGEWGGDKHIRLFNRTRVNWNDSPVHESLVLGAGITVKKLKGYVLHQTIKNIVDYAHKMVHYALLNADKYHKEGKKASWLKMILSPGFNFFNYYVLQLGFLDGYEGYICARMTAHYTFLKYARLRELDKLIANNKKS